VADTRLPFTRVIKGRYWRFRHKATGDRALPGQPGEEAFHSAYAELIAEAERVGRPRIVDRASFEWLIARYLASEEFAALADPTQRDYERTCELLKAELGEEPYRLATRAMIKTVRDDHAATPRKAHKIKQMASRLYSWADENELVPEGFNPAKGIRRLKRKGGEREIAVWSDAEIAMFLAAAPDFLRAPILIALYTGQRREDIARMTWNQFQGDIVRVRQSKTSALLDIACHPVLRMHLEELKKKRAGLIVCTTADGIAFTGQGLSEAIRRVVNKIPEMPRNRSLHGLRYAAGSRMDEAGCTVSEIEAVLGHRTFRMALKYASQRLRAKAAIGKLEQGNAS
jgi:integrase